MLEVTSFGIPPSASSTAAPPPLVAKEIPYVVLHRQVYSMIFVINCYAFVLVKHNGEKYVIICCRSLLKCVITSVYPIPRSSRDFGVGLTFGTDGVNWPSIKYTTT